MNRRTLELMVVVAALTKPVFGATRLWAHKTFNATSPGSITHGVAEVVVILLS